MSGNIVISDNPNFQLYGYIPSRGVAYTFVTHFLFSTLLHGYQLIKYRMWWIIPTVIVGGILETIAWSGRLWSSYAPTNSLPFKMQITCASFGPTPFLAANFVILGMIIKALGPSYSRLGPKRYTVVFCACDFFSILVQGGGGGIAASASNLKGANLGARVMLGGIVLQLLFILGCIALGTEFALRYYKGNAFPSGRGAQFREGFRGTFTPNIKMMSGALILSTFFLIVRSIYRIVELWDGWTSKVLHTEIYFNIFDAAMIFLAFFTLNVFHPGRLLAEPSGRTKGEEEGTRLNDLNVDNLNVDNLNVDKRAPDA